MKREIVCVECANKQRPKLEKTAAKHNEFFKTVSGALLHACLCDACNKELTRGDKAEAWSIATSPNAYLPWEAAYLLEAK